MCYNIQVKTIMILSRAKYLAIFLILLAAGSRGAAVCSDFEIDGTYEASLDLPQIYFLLKYSPEEPPILVEGEFMPNYAYLDTGASGILMSRGTADIMGIVIDANAVFVDTGVGGDEFFDVSEPLYIGTADGYSETPENPDIYRLCPQWRFQVSQEDGDYPIDVLGIPVMAGRTAVITPVKDFDIFGGEGDIDRWYTSANIVESNDANIPTTDFQVALRFEKYINPSNPLNVPPLPVLAYNPVIDNITIERGGISSTGNWLFDTGGQVSVISVAQGITLGLVDANGDPIVPANFYVGIGGIGGEVNLPGFTLDRLSVPTLNGFNLVFLNARVCVHDIGVLDERSGDFIILDGVFGDNFICSTIDTNSLEFDISSTPFDNIVIDTRRGLLGFDVNSVYPVPMCRFTDLNNDCDVDITDLANFSLYWLAADCNSSNGFCEGADIDRNGKVNYEDYAILADDWQSRKCQYACGSEKRPFADADLTHDCVVDIYDLEIITDEWLNACDWLNFNCRGGDFDRDGILNFKDFAEFAHSW
jgi:hypothetical protein